MAIKVKGLLRGLRYISQIFEDEKEKEIQIGLPTDVKHVAHIGWDGPSTDNNPSWMKEFKGPGQFQSAPLATPGDHKDNPEIIWVSEDSNRRSRNANSTSTGYQPEKPRSSRRHSAEKGGTDSPRRDSAKSRTSRRHHRKDSADGSKHGRQLQLDSTTGSKSPARDLPDIPRKSRRKAIPDGSATRSRSSKSKGKPSSTAPTLDPGSRPDPQIESLTNSETTMESSVIS